MKAGNHKSTHGLVRWLAPVDPESRREEQLNARIDTLETSLRDVPHKVQDSIASTVNERIAVIQDQVNRKTNEQLGRMEELLRVLGQRLLGGDEQALLGELTSQLAEHRATWPALRPGDTNGEPDDVRENELSA